jgi:hypothetical protein
MDGRGKRDLGACRCACLGAESLPLVERKRVREKRNYFVLCKAKVGRELGLNLCSISTVDITKLGTKTVL